MAHTEKPEKAVKANRGQDEVLHVITSPDGSESLTVTQREWKDSYRDLGYTKGPESEPDEEEEAPVEEGV